jgi:DNA-directed RNA polymerase subunit RPC12/RpoP
MALIKEMVHMECPKCGSEFGFRVRHIQPEHSSISEQFRVRCMFCQFEWGVVPTQFAKDIKETSK